MHARFPALLAQLFPNQAPPPALPGPPMLEHSLFEAPLGPACLFILAGVAGFFFFNRAGQARKALAAAGAGIGLAVITAVAASLVTTDREVVTRLSQELIRNVAAGDTKGIEPVLDGSSTVVLLGAPTGWNRRDILERVTRYTGERGMYRLQDREARIRQIAATSDSASTIRVQCRVSVTPEATALAHTTWWILTWQRFDPARPWQVTQIEIQQIEGMVPGSKLD